MTDALNLIEQVEIDLVQMRATAEALRGALDIARQQLEWHQRKRSKAWDGDFVGRLIAAGLSDDRRGCLTCGGRGWLHGHVEHLAYQEPCSDCDGGAPGFAPA